MKDIESVKSVRNNKYTTHMANGSLL